jgi:hypothetical protein
MATVCIAYVIYRSDQRYLSHVIVNYQKPLVSQFWNSDLRRAKLFLHPPMSIIEEMKRDGHDCIIKTVKMTEES